EDPHHRMPAGAPGLRRAAEEAPWLGPASSRGPSGGPSAAASAWPSRSDRAREPRTGTASPLAAAEFCRHLRVRSRCGRDLELESLRSTTDARDLRRCGAVRTLAAHIEHPG